METRKTVIGLKELLMSVVPASGLIADAEFSQLALNLEGTVQLNQEEAEETKINVEEQDTALVNILKAGDVIFESDIPDLRFEVAEKLLGATKTTENVEGASVTRVHLPDTAQYIYGMFKIVPKEGIEQFYINKGQISAYISGNLSKTETLNIHLKITALIPDAGETEGVSYDIAEGTNHGYLLGASLPEDNDWAVWAAAASNDAGVTITVDGGTPQAIVDKDFTAITSGQDVVDLLNPLTTEAATWSWDEDAFRFKLTSDSVGSTSAIIVADGTTTNLNIATLLNMQSETPIAGS